MLIVGAKGHAKELLDIIQSEERAFCFFDNVSKQNTFNLPAKSKVLRTKEEVLTYFKKDKRFVLGIGNPQLRRDLAKLLTSWGGILTTTTSKNAIVGKHDVHLAKGLNIMHGVIIYNSVSIGEGSLINTAASIHHDCTVGKYCEVSPGARILGGSSIGDYCNIGAGAIILPKVQLGKNVIVGAGAVVTKDVKDNTMVTGIPAKTIKKLPTIK